MTKRSRKTQKAPVKSLEYVTVAFAENIEQARDYETLLKADDIPVVIKQLDQTEQPGTKTIAVTVPENFLDEAHVVIESQDAYDDFYDFAAEDDPDDDFDDDLFDDDL